MSGFQESDFVEVASGLGYPEGPVALADGSLLAVDLKDGLLLGFSPGFSASWSLHLGGSPNGAAIGPDGALYVCNSGGFSFTTLAPPVLPWTLNIPVAAAPGFTGALIQRVDLHARTFETWCDTKSVAAPVDSCLSRGGPPFPLDPRGLRGCDDLVFDSAGGMWFTDWGKPAPFCRDITGVYYLPPGSRNPILKIPGRVSPNGIRLSPDESRLYVAESVPRWIVAFDLDGPGSVRCGHTLDGAVVVSGAFPGGGEPDSMAIDQHGNLYVATMVPKGLDPTQSGGIAVFSPSGKVLDYIQLNVHPPEPLPSNICFGGPDRRTAFVTLAGTGRIVSCKMRYPGLKPAFGG